MILKWKFKWDFKEKVNKKFIFNYVFVVVVRKRYILLMIFKEIVKQMRKQCIMRIFRFLTFNRYHYQWLFLVCLASVQILVESPVGLPLLQRNFFWSFDAYGFFDVPLFFFVCLVFLSCINNKIKKESRDYNYVKS